MAGLEGKILGDCRMIKRLGEGGMGQVYLAEQVRLGRQVAVKVLRPPRPAGGRDDGPAPLADAPERFQLEARAVAALEHPNILPVHDFGMADELMYLVMPLMPDGSLLDAVRPGSSKRRFYLPMEPAAAAPLVFQAASALQYAHDHHVIHRDVKPENFLIRPERDGSVQLLLADFGLAKLYNPASGSATLAVGTADYVAPEQIEGHPVPASDQYALAVMTYELLLGRLPFTGGVGEVALKHLRTPPPAPHTINPNFPPEVEEVLLRALSKKAEDRWPSVLEFARAYNEAVKALEKRQRSKGPVSEEETIPSYRGAPSAPPQPGPSGGAAQGEGLPQNYPQQGTASRATGGGPPPQGYSAGGHASARPAAGDVPTVITHPPVPPAPPVGTQASRATPAPALQATPVYYSGVPTPSAGSRPARQNDSLLPVERNAQQEVRRGGMSNAMKVLLVLLVLILVVGATLVVVMVLGHQRHGPGGVENDIGLLLLWLGY